MLRSSVLDLLATPVDPVEVSVVDRESIERRLNDCTFLIATSEIDRESTTALVRVAADRVEVSDVLSKSVDDLART